MHFDIPRHKASNSASDDYLSLRTLNQIVSPHSTKNKMIRTSCLSCATPSDMRLGSIAVSSAHVLRTRDAITCRRGINSGCFRRQGRILDVRGREGGTYASVVGRNWRGRHMNTAEAPARLSSSGCHHVVARHYQTACAAGCKKNYNQVSISNFSAKEAVLIPIVLDQIWKFGTAGRMAPC